MNPENKVFFGEHGITSTSAQYLRNLAEEDMAEIQADLNSVTFLTVTMTIIGSGVAPTPSAEGKDEDYVNNISKMIAKCIIRTQFISYINEAINAKKAEEQYWKDYSFERWAEEVAHVELPKPNYGELPKEKDIIAEMNIKEREEYYALESAASVIGKYIHPSPLDRHTGAFNKARKALHEGLAKPTWTEGNGRDTVIYNNMASVKSEIVDAKFNELQNDHRSYNQRLNSIKAKIQEELHKRVIEYNSNKAAEIKRVKEETDLLITQYTSYIKERLEETRKLKIVIPERLRDIYDYLNSLGKIE